MKNIRPNQVKGRSAHFLHFDRDAIIHLTYSKRLFLSEVFLAASVAGFLTA